MFTSFRLRRAQLNKIYKKLKNKIKSTVPHCVSLCLCLTTLSLENCGSVQEVPGDAAAAALSGGEEIQWR